MYGCRLTAGAWRDTVGDTSQRQKERQGRTPRVHYALAFLIVFDKIDKPTDGLRSGATDPKLAGNFGKTEHYGIMGT